MRRPLFAILAAVFLLAITGTIAFVFEQMDFNNKFQLASEEIDHIETFDSPDDWQPCDEEPKTVVTHNKSNHPIKVRLSYDEWWRNQADTAYLPLEDNGLRLAVINFQNEDDWEKIGDWYYWKGTLAPGESTRSLFKSVTLDCHANLAVQHICNGTTCEDVHSPYEGANYHINITVQTTDEDFPHDDEYFNVSINPNGGEFNGSSEIYTDSIQYGTYIDLANISYADHELVDWTLNGSTSYTDSRIRITNHTNLVANWRSSIFHNVTVDPNGGSLDGNTEPVVTNIRRGESFTLTDTIPTRDDYIFNHWNIKIGDAEPVPLTDYTFTITDDAVITATWDKIIAKNVQTNAVYPSINSAITAANSGETILLVTDTEEAVTVANDRNLTLDLGEHIVTGSLVNAGILTLLNGEINNPDGIALTNSGTLTMGIDDYTAEGPANIDEDYVRLVGTTVGLKQDGLFYFYDGYIEGDIALEGGYDGSPFYRNTFDDVIVYFFPFVDHNNIKDCQRVILESSDNAVSKTSVKGDIYYYNLQDNIDTSIRTGYKIYIVRDFDAGYAITSPADTSVTIDLAGYNVSINDTITINGTLNFEDSTTTITRGDATIVYGGLISTPQTIVNNGTLNLTNIKITGTTDNDTIINNSTVNMTASTLAATTGYVMQPKEDTTWNLDEDSYLYSTSTSKPTVYNVLSDFTWNKGNIYGAAYAVFNYGTMAIRGGRIESTRAAVRGYSGSSTVIDGGNLIVNDVATTQDVYGISTDYRPDIVIKSGKITVYKTKSGNATGVTGNITLDGGEITVTKTGSGSAYGATGYLTMNGGNISVDGATNAYGIHKVNPFTMNGGSISVNGSGATYGVYDGVGTINDGTITVTNTSTNKASYGVYTSNSSGVTSGWESAITINGGAVSSTTSGTGASYGVYVSGTRYSDHLKKYTLVTGGTIEGTSAGGSGYGLYQTNTYKVDITGGKISGSTCGVFADVNNASRSVTIGTNGDDVSQSNPEIIGGEIALNGSGIVNYYDGVLRGGTKAYKDGLIKAIPEARTYHIESSEDFEENCWLIAAENYLSVGDDEYNSLSSAYAAITGESGTIKVIKSVTVEAVLPDSPADKAITFDLNGYELTYTQPLIVGGNMTIVDSSAGKTGRLHNPNSTKQTIINNGTLTIESGHISGNYRTIEGAKGSTININGGTITSTATGIYSNGSNSAGNEVKINITGGLIKISGTGSNALYGTYGTVAVNMTGGQLLVEREEGAPNAAAYGVYSNSGGEVIINVPDDTVAVKVTNANGEARGVQNAVLESGDIKVSGSTNAYGVNGSLAMNGGSVHVDGAANAYGVYSPSSFVMNGGNITVDSKGTNYGVYDGVSTINDGTITVTNTSTNKDAYGIYNSNGSSISNSHESVVFVYGGTITSSVEGTGTSYGVYVSGTRYSNFLKKYTMISGGTIEGTSAGGSGYGLYQTNTYKVDITGGKISGSTYGVFANVNNASRAVTIGVNEDGVSPSNPEITGGNLALGGAGFVNYYDGVLRGGVKAYQDGLIKAIAADSAIHIEQQSIGDVEYDTRWLIPEYNVVQIGGQKYTKLQDAIDAAQENDRIEFIADNHIFEAVNIASDKNIIIDTNGYSIYSSYAISNNGRVLLRNPSAAVTTTYSGQDYFITNAEGASLELSNFTINAPYAINNMGSLTLNNTSIEASNIAIKNSGNITGNNNTIKGLEYSIYSDGGEADLGSNAITGHIYTNSGKVSLTGGTIEKDGVGVTTNIDGETNLNNIQASFSYSNYASSSASSKYSYPITNSGTLTIKDSTISHILLDRTNVNVYTINNSGTINLENTNIAVDASASTTRPYAIYAIYNTTGNVDFVSGSIQVSDKTVYGIYNNSGTVTIGVPEDPDSPDYGKATASVSITDPSIKAIGATTGIGIKNNTGKIYYYDGRITGSTAAMPEKPAGVEYLYEPKDYLDEDGYHYRILEWMREQPGN